MRRKLLAWFARERRELPWRADEGSLSDPYAVWVSEVMLQQTRVEVVRDYYARWMGALPTLKALAAASEDDVLRLWQGLGYYSRARRLREGARFVLQHHQGQLPRDREELLRVPGIGPYSAGAIASIAYGVQAPVVDGNVIRVLSRIFALPGDPSRSPLKGRLWDLAGELVPSQQPGEFNQAVMELGALVCTPRKPQCGTCPLRRECRALILGDPTAFPQLPKKAAPTQLRMAVALLVRRGRVLLEKQSAEARWWAGLWTFPFFELALDETPEDAAVRSLARFGIAQPVVEVLPSFTHTVTRFRITLTPLRVRAPAGYRPPRSFGGQFQPFEQLAQLPMPAPHRRLEPLL